MNRQPNVVVGALLIGLAIVWWLNLWGLILPVALIAGGVLGYQQRRRIGDAVGAVQAGLWLAGLGLLFLLHFVFPGVLLLAGASILLRGRELQADDQVQAFLANLGSRGRTPQTTLPRQSVPVSVEHSTDAATTNETTRL